MFVETAVFIFVAVMVVAFVGDMARMLWRAGVDFPSDPYSRYFGRGREVCNAYHASYAYAQRAEEDARRRQDQYVEACIMLDATLTPTQRLQLKRENFFEVRGGTTGHLYRIYRANSGNVRLVLDNRERVQLCAAPEYLHTPAAMLAQKLMLECDEARFLDVANHTRLL